MKKKVLAIPILLLAASSARAQEPSNIVKSLFRVVSPGALSMPGMAMPSIFPNTYDSTITTSFDQNAGSQGTLYLNYTFTGTTESSPMCNYPAKHYPRISLVVFNNGTLKSTHYAAGYQINPCAEMNQTLTVALDLGLDNCDIAMLVDGECTMSEQEDGVFCTYMVADFATIFKKFQYESATSETQTVRAGLPFPQAPWCGDTSDPPDFFIKTSATNPTGYFVATATLIRWQRFGSTFKGVPWGKLIPIGLATAVQAGPKPVCTQYDKGCRWGAMFCTGSPNGPETKLHVPKWAIKPELAVTETKLKGELQ